LWARRKKTFYNNSVLQSEVFQQGATVMKFTETIDYSDKKKLEFWRGTGW